VRIRKGKDPRYAIKQLSDDIVLQDPHNYINGLMDLAIEARFLAVIRHPNIIKMRAVGVGTPYSRDFFIMLDRLCLRYLDRSSYYLEETKAGWVEKVD
jgi:hypothetical protein